jgi:hypothetical protein
MSDQPVLPPNKIAFILDGKVQDVFHTDDRLAAILLSQPTIVDVTDKYEGHKVEFNIIQWKYDGTDFTAPETETTIN